MKQPTLLRGMLALVITTGLASASVAAFAQQAPLPIPQTRPDPAQGPGVASNDEGMPVTDADFVRMMAGMSNAEVIEARYVLRNTQNPVVRNFAQQMIDDHSSAAVSLRSTVRSNGDRYGVDLNRVSPSAVDQIAVLRTLSGRTLDRLYMDYQTKMHRHALAIAQYEANNGMDPALRSFAAAQLPAITSHMEMTLAYSASSGQSTSVDVAGIVFGARGPGVNMPPNGPNGTGGINPAVHTNGTTSGADNGTGGVKNGNPLNDDEGGTPSLAASTPQPTPTTAASSPAP
jgi:putative membrane protein